MVSGHCRQGVKLDDHGNSTPKTTGAESADSDDRASCILIQDGQEQGV